MVEAMVASSAVTVDAHAAEGWGGPLGEMTVPSKAALLDEKTVVDSGVH